MKQKCPSCNSSLFRNEDRTVVCINVKCYDYRLRDFSYLEYEKNDI